MLSCHDTFTIVSWWFFPLHCDAANLLVLAWWYWLAGTVHQWFFVAFLTFLFWDFITDISCSMARPSAMLLPLGHDSVAIACLLVHVCCHYCCWLIETSLAVQQDLLQCHCHCCSSFALAIATCWVRTFLPLPLPQHCNAVFCNGCLVPGVLPLWCWCQQYCCCCVSVLSLSLSLLSLLLLSPFPSLVLTIRIEHNHHCHQQLIAIDHCCHHLHHHQLIVALLLLSIFYCFISVIVIITIAIIAVVVIVIIVMLLLCCMPQAAAVLQLVFFLLLLKSTKHYSAMERITYILGVQLYA